MDPQIEPPPPRRVLLVEDEVLLAMSLEDHLGDFGWTVVGPCHDLATALATAEAAQFDCAILDVNLNGQMVFPLAERLMERQMPFVFVTGYAAANLPPHLRAVPRVGKPYDGANLLKVLARLV